MHAAESAMIANVVVILVAQTWGEGIDFYSMIFIDIPYILSNIIKLGCRMISFHIMSTSTNQQILCWINISLHKTHNGPLSLCIGVTSWMLSTSLEVLAPSPSEASCSSALRFMILKATQKSPSCGRLFEGRYLVQNHVFFPACKMIF